MKSIRYPLFCKGDLDGFFGLAVDNLVQVLVIAALCKELCGFSDTLLFTTVFPGIAVSLLVGNLFYAIQAHWVARRDGNATCTALPYGINTPSVFAYILFIMAPVYARYSGNPDFGPQRAADLAWKVGLVACIGSGVIEFLGAFIGGWIRRVTPRAALLSALAAIGIIFIASPFAFQIFERPLVAMVPLFIVLIGYFGHVRFPFGLPAGLVAVVIGTALAWTVPLAVGTPIMDADKVRAAAQLVAVHKPVLCWGDIVSLMTTDRNLLWSFLGVIVPMGLVNAIGSLQNIESAEAAGDHYSTGISMVVNGVGTIAAGLFGSCFPTTIYIGHPGWKALGARSGYSILNGLFFTIAFTLGLGALIVSVIPMESGMAIVMYIGIIIAAQSYSAVPTRHYPAVAIGFFPAVAMMAVLLVPQILTGSGATGGILPMLVAHGEKLKTALTDSWWPIGVYSLAGANSGFVITGIIISAACACLIDRRFRPAAIWCFIGAAMTLLGFQHAFRVEPGPFALSPQELLFYQRTEAYFAGTRFFVNFPEYTYLHRAYQIAGGYALAGVMMWVMHALRARGRAFGDLAVDVHDMSIDVRAMTTDAHDRASDVATHPSRASHGPEPDSHLAPSFVEPPAQESEPRPTNL